ncbi:hypothetical protein Kisp01_38150 [Kineosporia sp. NBRC 101677]|nr:hypothetical protein Kisp01_38150 [Kineosporia sp. NBRC 101677]
MPELSAAERARLPLDVHRLELLPEGETGGFDIDALPPLDAPVVHRHVLDLSPEAERALRAEAAERGVTVDEVIRARVEDAA